MVSAIIVDDEIAHLTIFEDLLKTISVNVVGKAKNGKEAVEQYEKHQPDVIFLDLMMPDYDGFYAIERIKKISTNAKIVIVSADTRNSTTSRLQELGIDSILYKPFEMAQLKQILTDKLKIQI